MSIAIRPCTVASLDAAPEFAALLAEYGAESSIDGLPPPKAQLDIYAAIERTGALQIYGAFRDDALIGFIVFVVTVLPHYGVRVATTESFFVGRAHRGTGAGLALLRAAEDKAHELGALGFLVSAPLGGRLADVMERLPGYRETNRVFFRSLDK